ncbi:MAG: PAS domain-containing protein [Acidobacteriota bacterium]
MPLQNIDPFKDEIRSRLVLEAANIGIWELNVKTKTILFSENFFKILDIEKKNFDGKYISFLNLIHRDDRTIVKKTLSNSIKNKTPFDTEFRIICKCDTERWFRIRGNIKNESHSKSLTLVGSIHDKTERKIALDTLEESHSVLEESVKERTQTLEKINKQLREEIAENRAMKKIVMDISEKERQKIGQDLHDSLAQQIGGIIFMTQALNDRLFNMNIQETKELKKVIKYLKNTLKYVRNLSKSLYLTFGETGFKFALTELIEMMRELYKLDVKLSYDKSIDIKDENIATNLYRIIQEALNNAVKHGHAKRAEIIIKKEKDTIKVRIKDHGTGFPPLLNRKGMGLKIMKYRASQLGSSFTIASDKSGTEILFFFKVKGRYEK